MVGGGGGGRWLRGLCWYGQTMARFNFFSFLKIYFFFLVVILIGIQHVCRQLPATSLGKHRWIASCFSSVANSSPVSEPEGQWWKLQLPDASNRGATRPFYKVPLTAQSILLPLTLPLITLAVACTSGPTNPLIWFLRESSCLASCFINVGVSHLLCLCLKPNTLTSLRLLGAVQEGTVHLGWVFVLSQKRRQSYEKLNDNNAESLKPCSKSLKLNVVRGDSLLTK